MEVIKKTKISDNNVYEDSFPINILLKLTRIMMKKLHIIAISTNKIKETIDDYTIRLGIEPCLFVPNEYALWRTDSLNVSIRQDPSCTPGELRHLGWEDDSAEKFSQNIDIKGIIWEHFNAQQQADKINKLWPEINYQPED